MDMSLFEKLEAPELRDRFSAVAFPGRRRVLVHQHRGRVRS